MFRPVEDYKENPGDLIRLSPRSCLTLRITIYGSRVDNLAKYVTFPVEDFVVVLDVSEDRSSWKVLHPEHGTLIIPGMRGWFYELAPETEQ